MTTVAEPAEQHVRPSAEPGRGRSRMPLVALAAVVLVATVVYAAAASLVEVPRVHPDELRYTLGGASLANGEGLNNRGEEYGFGPFHAAMLAGILVVAGDRETAYPLFKLANALLFALTAIPVFLLARRLLGPWWSLGVAAFSVTLPASIYVSVVMTESVSYVSSLLAIYTIVLTLERPTVGRQLAAIAAIGLASGMRMQFALLFFALLTALAAGWALSRPRSALGAELRRLWPVLGAVVLASAAFFGRPLLSGSSPGDALGPYTDVWSSYEPWPVLKWFAYHLADVELYLVVAPFAVAPIVLTRLFRGARAGDERQRAFLLAFVSVNLVLVLMTAAFATQPYGYDRLHDRYLFYVLPLWLIVFAVWLADGLPRPLLATSVGIALALALPVILPFSQLANEAGVDTVPGALWVWVQENAGEGFVNGRRLLGSLVIAMLIAVVALPRRYWPALPAAVLAVVLATSVLAWDRMVGAPEDAVFKGGLERAWIDKRLPAEASVTKLYVDTACGSALQRHALFLTEFFNSTVDAAAFVRGSVPDGLPIERVDVSRSGALELSPGNPLVAEYVFTQPGVVLNGRRLATGTNADLVLWKIGGPVRVPEAASNGQLRRLVCA